LPEGRLLLYYDAIVFSLSRGTDEAIIGSVPLSIIKVMSAIQPIGNVEADCPRAKSKEGDWADA
jgi:hypothetical protein